jgi:hypothetical protein
MKDDRVGADNPFHVFYTDPEYFNDMELDSENRVLYAATNYGLFTKNLETGEFCNMGMWFGFEDSRIAQIELDDETNRLYVVDECNPIIYVIDTEKLRLLEKLVIIEENGNKLDADIDKLTLDSGKNRIFAASNDHLLDIDLDSGMCEMIYSVNFFDPLMGRNDWHHVQDMRFIVETGLVYLATLRGLIIYNPENGSGRRISDCEVLCQRTHGMDLDKKNGNLYIAGYRLVKFNVFSEEWVQYPYIYKDRRNNTLIPMDEYPERDWDDLYPLFRVCYDPLRDEVYSQVVTYHNLIRFDGSEPEMLRDYFHDDYEGESFAQSTTCRIIYDPVTNDIIFGHGQFKTGGSSSWTGWDDETRLMWYRVDEDTFEKIGIFRKNPGPPDHWNEFYWLRTTPLHDGLVVGNYHSLFLLDDEMNIVKDYSFEIQQVFDMEFRGADLFVSADNGTFVLNFINMTLYRIGVDDSLNFYGVDIPDENGPVYLGSAYGVYVYHPENGSLRHFDPLKNRTNPMEGNFSNFGRLAPGGIYVHPDEDIVYIYTDRYSDLLELDLETGKYTYLNNLTIFVDGEVEHNWEDERIGMVVYCQQLDDLIIMTHRGLRNGTYGKDPMLPQTASLNSIYLDEEEDILYAVTGEFPLFDSMGPQGSWPSGSPQGFFRIYLNNGSFDNFLNKDGMPWIWNKGFHYDEDRDRIYFAGGRCFYWIDREDLDNLYEGDEVQRRNITIISGEDDDEKREHDILDKMEDENNKMVLAIIIVSILIVILLVVNIFIGRKGRYNRDRILILRMNR